MKRKACIVALFVTLAVSLGLIFASCSSKDQASTGVSAVYITNNTDTSHTQIRDGADISGGNTGTGGGTVADRGTDTDSSIDLSLYSRVTATITNIKIINTGSELRCPLVGDPVIVNLAGIENVMQFSGVAKCVPGSYNRIQIRFDRRVDLLSGPTATPAVCYFDSYKDTGNSSQPNILQCAENMCTLSINGAVNVLANQTDKIALDFHLKDFTVSNPDTPECSVTMKVLPLTAFLRLGHPEAITGIISNLSATNAAFDLTRGNETFSVLYSEISATDQPGLNSLLERAQSDRLRARVASPDIDFTDNSIMASAVMVKVEGMVSDVTNTTFLLNYGPGGASHMFIDYSNADVEGTIADDAWLEIKLYGYSRLTDAFLAGKVEVETAGLVTED